MEYRTLGRTGVKVSPLCLGAMMFGAWGEPDHDKSIRIIHAALDAGINFVDTADVYSRARTRRSSARRSKAAATTSSSPRSSTARWATAPTQGQLAALDHARRRGLAAAPADRPHRPLPGAPPRRTPTSRRRCRRSPTSSGREDPLLRLLDLSGEHDRRGAVGRARPRPRALQDRAAALQHARARDRGRRPPHRATPRHGRDPVEPARRRLAVRPLPQGASCRPRPARTAFPPATT